MNIRRKIISAFFAFLLLFGATGCDIADDLLSGLLVPESSSSSSSHVHTFYNDWSFDENTHYHEASCGHNLYSERSSHDYSVWQVVKEANEYEDGLKERYCFVCGYEQTQTINYQPPHQHSYYKDKVVPATCESNGYTRYKCSCGDYYDTDIIPALEHTYNSYYSYDEECHWIGTSCGHEVQLYYSTHTFIETVIIEPTTEENGSGYKECIDCKYLTWYTIPKLTHYHDYAPVFEWNADSNKPLTVRFVCQNYWGCELAKSEFEYWYDKTVISEGSCEEERNVVYSGTAYYKGEYYYDTFVDYAPAAGHQYYLDYSYNSDFHWRDSSCGHALTIDYGPHNFYESIIVAPTETEYGQAYIECSTCLYYEYVTLSPLNHIHSYQPYFYWTPNNDDKLVVTIECSDNKYHKVDSSQYKYWYEVFDQYVPSCGEYGHTYYRGYLEYDGTLYTEEYYYSYYQEHDNSGIYEYNNYHHWLNATCEHDTTVNYSQHDFYTEVIKSASYYSSGEGYAYCKTCPYSYYYTTPKLSEYHYYEPVYNWDFSNAYSLSVDMVCKSCSNHKLPLHEYYYLYYSNIYSYPSCSNEGLTVHNVEVQYNGNYYYESKEEITPKTEHSFSTYYTYDDTHHWNYSWCGHDVKDNYEEHILVHSVITSPSDYECGQGYAECETCDYYYYYEIEPLVHKHEYEPVFIWDLDQNDILSVEFYCIYDSEHKLDSNLYNYWYNTIQRIDPTCDHDGYGIYTAHAYYNNIEYTNEYEGVIKTKGHRVSEYYYSYDNNYHWLQSDCGHYSGQEKIPHNFVETIITPATDTDFGYAKKECIECDYEDNYTLYPSTHIHNYAPDFYWDLSNDQILNVEFHCNQEFRHQLGVNEYSYWYEIIEQVEPTCDKVGYIYVIGYASYNDNLYTNEQTLVLNKKEHESNGNYGYDSEYHWYESSCEHDAKVDYEKHVFSESILTEPTETEYGLSYFKCDYCGYDYYLDTRPTENKHLFSPIFYWDPNTDYVLNVEFVCQYHENCKLDRHEYMYWYEISYSYEPTCDSNGYAEYICYAQYKAERYTEYYEYSSPKRDHYYKENYSYNEEYHWHDTLCWHSPENYEPHDVTETIIYDATETEYGKGYGECNTCDYTYYFDIFPTSHVHDYYASFQWDTENEVLKVEYKCIYSSRHVLDSSEFTYWYEIINQLEPTCEYDGYIEYMGYSIYNGNTTTNGYHQYLYKLNHEQNNFYSYDDECHWIGTTCGHDERWDQSEHNYIESIISEPTETSEGQGYVECETCGYCYYFTIYPDSYNYTYSPVYYWDLDNRFDHLDVEYVCDQDPTIKLPRHKYNYYYNSLAYSSPNCGSDGYAYYRVYSYQTTNYVNIEQDFEFILPATEHTFSDYYTYNEQYHWKEAWCGHIVQKDMDEHHLEHSVMPDGSGYAKCDTCDYGYYYEITI